MNTARATLVFLLSTLFLTGTLIAQSSGTGKESQQNTANSLDSSFIKLAAEANLGEIQAAKIVLQKSTDPAVKDFANRMVTDHTQASHTLATLAEMNHVDLPGQAADAERQAAGKLRQLSGPDLDRTYLRDELEGHKAVISAFEKEIEQGRQPDFKHYAEQTLPTLQDHIRIAENVAGRLGISGASGLANPANAIAAK